MFSYHFAKHKYDDKLESNKHLKQYNIENNRTHLHILHLCVKKKLTVQFCISPEKYSTLTIFLMNADNLFMTSNIFV